MENNKEDIKQYKILTTKQKILRLITFIISIIIFQAIDNHLNLFNDINNDYYVGVIVGYIMALTSFKWIEKK